jgi:DNA-3-methyladenine glycosylase II
VKPYLWGRGFCKPRGLPRRFPVGSHILRRVIVRVRPTAALRHLRAADPTFAKIIDDVGPCRFKPRAEGSHFDAIVRSIVYQQITGKAAATILGRLHAHFGGRPPTAKELAEASEDELRTAGLSRQKQRYMRDLAERAAAGLVEFERFDELPDEQIVAELTAIKGIGPWTAQIFLMFRLGRADVLPIADLGIQKAVQRGWRMRKLPKPAQVAKLGTRWAPHRTVASWYLWRSLDGDAAL